MLNLPRASRPATDAHETKAVGMDAYGVRGSPAG